MHPGFDAAHITLVEQNPGMFFEQIHGVREIFRRQGVINRILRHRLALVPPASTLVQFFHAVRMNALQMIEQQIREEVMIAVPRPLIIQRDDEQVR